METGCGELDGAWEVLGNRLTASDGSAEGVGMSGKGWSAHVCVEAMVLRDCESLCSVWKRLF